MSKAAGSISKADARISHTPASRVLCFWLCYVRRLRILFEVYDALTRWTARHAFGSRPCHGVDLVSYLPDGLSDLQQIVLALEFIQKTDVRRFHRIEQHIRCIALASRRRSGYMGSYWPVFHVCHVAQLPGTNRQRQVVVWLYAQILIHESTHALLNSMRFPSNRANKERIEKLCSTEAIRFIGRVLRGHPEMCEPYVNFVSEMTGFAAPSFARL